MRRRDIFLGILVLTATPIVPAVLYPALSSRAMKPPADGPRKLVGSISCATSLCHGGAELGKPGSEFTTWIGSDPHARAYETLHNAQSKHIASQLSLKNPAHEEPLCLKCHVDPGYADARPNFNREHGVSCESCHGAAGDWLAPHYRADWKTRDKQALGMADTKSLHGRAGMCVRCHVGTTDAEVNHDLIAAGHPVLRFEFATYFANLPPHWDVARDRKANGGGDFEMQTWTVGQLVSSACAFELLAHRAENGKTWPEFAELDCFACHHDLKAKTWRQQKEHVGKRRPGTPTWNAWHRAMVPDALQLAKSPKIDEATKMLAELGQTPLDRIVGNDAKHLAGMLREAARKTIATDGAGLALFGPKRAPDRSWDEATQRFLALRSLRQWHQDNQKPIDDELERLIDTLGKEVTIRDYQSPREFVPGINR